MESNSPSIGEGMKGHLEVTAVDVSAQDAEYTVTVNVEVWRTLCGDCSDDIGVNTAVSEGAKEVTKAVSGSMV